MIYDNDNDNNNENNINNNDKFNIYNKNNNKKNDNLLWIKRLSTSTKDQPFYQLKTDTI